MTNTIDTENLQANIDRLNTLKNNLTAESQVCYNTGSADMAGDVADGFLKIDQALDNLLLALTTMVEKTATYMEQRRASVDDKEQAHTNAISGGSGGGVR